MKKRSLLKTGDGSHTFHLPEWNEQYHSRHGAIAEALHVFIENGLFYRLAKEKMKEIAVLEIGFGTGLNCMLTLLKTEEEDCVVHYTGVEGFPLSVEEVEMLNFPELLETDPSRFLEIHRAPWNKPVPVSESFRLEKRHQLFAEITDQEAFDLIYFDAFGMRVQPELWTETIFKKMFQALRPGGVLVTYASNGIAKRAMETVGFSLERLPGPPGKKHMVRAVKK